MKIKPRNKRTAVSEWRSVAVTFLTLCFFHPSVNSQSNDQLSQRLASLGGPLPYDEPKVFASDFVSLDGRIEFGITMNNMADTVYFGVDLGNRSKIYEVRFDGQEWQSPTVLLSNDEISFNDPMLSQDQSRLYFITNLKDEFLQDFDIGFIERENAGWSSPQIDTRISSSEVEYFYSESIDNEVFFARQIGTPQNSHFDIFSYHPNRNPSLSRLADSINSPFYEGDPFVSANGDMLLFVSSRPTGKGRGDIYISFREEHGWSEAKPLPSSINTQQHELTPYISPDGQWLFFARAGDLYWVSIDAVLPN